MFRGTVTIASLYQYDIGVQAFPTTDVDVGLLEKAQPEQHCGVQHHFKQPLFCQSDDT